MESAGNVPLGVSGLGAARKGRLPGRALVVALFAQAVGSRYMGALSALAHALADKPCINEKARA